jgi:hypothetical protein
MSVKAIIPIPRCVQMRRSLREVSSMLSCYIPARSGAKSLPSCTANLPRCCNLAPSKQRPAHHRMYGSRWLRGPDTRLTEHRRSGFRCERRHRQRAMGLIRFLRAGTDGAQVRSRPISRHRSPRGGFRICARFRHCPLIRSPRRRRRGARPESRYRVLSWSWD